MIKKSTRVLWHNIGDGLVAMSVFLSATSFASDVSWLALSATITGALGMFLTKAFPKESKDD